MPEYNKTVRPELVEGPNSPAEAERSRSRSASTEPHPDATLPLIAVTGPQRGKLRGSRLNPYFAVPHGDMMVSGCFGILWAFAEKHPEQSDAILTSLGIAP